VSLLLGLAKKYCDSWQHEVRSFLASVPVGKLLSRIGGYMNSSSSGGSSGVGGRGGSSTGGSGGSGSGSGSSGSGGGCSGSGSGVDAVNASRSSSDNSVSGEISISASAMELPLLPSDVLIQEAIILQRTLQLYLQLRIIRVRCDECSVLRQLAWIITVSTLYRRVGGGVSGGIVLTVAELNDIVAGGVSLFGATGASVDSSGDSMIDLADISGTVEGASTSVTSTVANTTVNTNVSTTANTATSNTSNTSNPSNTSTYTPDHTRTTSRIHTTGTALLHLFALRQTFALPHYSPTQVVFATVDLHMDKHDGTEILLLQ